MTAKQRLGPFLVLALALLPGCGTGRPAVYPVTGSVTVKGKPAAGAVVVLLPNSPVGPDTYQPTGVVGPDGSFKLTTFQPDDGAPAGEYKVAVTWRPAKRSAMEPDGPDKLGGKYADAGVGKLSAKVDAGPTTLPPFALD